MAEQEQSQRGSLEEMVRSHLVCLREDPLDRLDGPWFDAVTELLLAMHPEIAIRWRHRVTQELERHAVLHGCQAVEHFDYMIEEALRAWTAAGSL